jgi:replication factor C small subunit
LDKLLKDYVMVEEDAGLPWTEKYRPAKLDGVVGQEEVIKRMKAYVKEKNMPNLLLAGKAGIGKTTASLALAHELYRDNFRQNFLELNASDERGIDVIRGKIKDFAGIVPFGDIGFKIIFLDESDSLTKDAQNALRRTMERYTKTCRFILSCNYSSKIIEPIQSRCALFRFTPLSDGEIKGNLKKIAEAEKTQADAKAYEALVGAAGGDMRKAINLLQLASTAEKKISEDIVYKVAAKARPEEVSVMVETALKGDFKKSRERLMKLMYEYALSAEDILLQIYGEIVSSDKIDDDSKVVLIDRLGEADFRVTEGANERIQLEAFLAQLVLIGKRK